MTHNELQHEVKKIFELHGYKVIENVEGRSKSGKRQEPGISDLTAVKLPNVYWIEIKVGRDKQNENQIKFEKSLTKKHGKYIIIKDDANDVYKYLI